MYIRSNFSRSLNTLDKENKYGTIEKPIGNFPSPNAENTYTEEG